MSAAEKVLMVSHCHYRNLKFEKGSGAARGIDTESRMVISE